MGPQGPAGPQGDTGHRGLTGHAGETGPQGAIPDHQWDGTRLRFEEPDGTWGDYVDLQGPRGTVNNIMGAGGGGRGMTPEQALQLDTLLAIFGGWIDHAPLVSMTLSTDELTVNGIGDATGFYPTVVPPGALLDAAYEWDWGDGTLSTTLNASHTYAEAGTYTVQFRAHNHIGWSLPDAEDVTLSGTPPDVDPFWADTVLVLQGDSLTDATGRHVVNVHNGVPTFGADGIVFDGATALRIDDNLGDFAFPGSFTLEGQLNGVSAGAATAVLLSTIGATGEFEIFTRGAPNYNAGFYSISGSYVEPSSPPWITDTLHDWAVQYDADTTVFSMWLDGVQIASTTGDAHNYVPSPLRQLFIGRESVTDAKFFKGSLRVRITKAARIAGTSYTPPTWPVPTS